MLMIPIVQNIFFDLIKPGNMRDTPVGMQGYILRFLNSFTEACPSSLNSILLRRIYPCLVMLVRLWRSKRVRPDSTPVTWFFIFGLSNSLNATILTVFQKSFTFMRYIEGYVGNEQVEPL